MRESRTYGSVRGACDETHVPTATPPRLHIAHRRRGGDMAALSARAAAHERCPPYRWLVNLASDNAEVQARMGAFLQGLQEFGWSIGRNVRIEYRWASNPSDLPRYAAELVALGPDVVLANANPSVDALQKVSRTIPIVFVATTDPVGSGIAQSLAQPGGNAT